jgi:hypothetical protein
MPAFVDRVGDGVGERARIADTGGAAVAYEIEAQGVEIVVEAGGGQVVGHHFRSGCQGGLDPGLGLQTLFQRLFGDEAGLQHDARVRGVGAAGDRRDDDVAMAEFGVHARDRLRLVGGHVAAQARQGLDEAVLDLGQDNPVLRPLRAGKRRDDRGQVELERFAEDGVGQVVGPPHALRLGVGLDQLDPLLLAAGESEVVEGHLVDREEAAGGTVFGRHVGDGGTIGQGQLADAGAEELDELADHAGSAQHLRDGQDEVGGRGALGQLAGELEAHDLGQQHGDGLAEHRGLGLDAADPPAEHGEAIDHGGVAVGADQRVGIGHLGVAVLGGPDDLGEVLEVDLVADAGAGRDDAEIVERTLPPAQEGVALAVALVFELDIAPEAVVAAEAVDLDAVVDDEVAGAQGVDAGGVAAECDHGLAHGGEVDHGRHAGEVLHQHAGRAVGDLLVGAAMLEPGGCGLDVVDGDGAAVLEPEQVFDQDLEREGQPREVAQLLLRLGQREVVVAGAIDVERTPHLERILSTNAQRLSPSAWPCRFAGPRYRTAPPGSKGVLVSQEETARTRVARHLKWRAGTTAATSALQPPRGRAQPVTRSGIGRPAKQASRLSRQRKPIALRVSSVALPTCGRRKALGRSR